MTEKKTTKLANTKICRCCCRHLIANDHPISLFGEKSRKEGILEGFNDVIGSSLKVNGEEYDDRLSDLICRCCVRRIKTVTEFRALCIESDRKQRTCHRKSANTRMKRGKKLEESPSAQNVSPSAAHTTKKTRPGNVANPPVKVRLADRFGSSSSTPTLIPIAPTPAVQQHSDMNSTAATTRQLPAFLKPKVPDNTELDKERAVEILSCSGLHKNTHVDEPPAARTTGVLTPVEKETLIARIMESSPPALAEAMMKIPLIKSCVKSIILQDIDSQCRQLCQRKENPPEERKSICPTNDKGQPEGPKQVSMDICSD